MRATLNYMSPDEKRPEVYLFEPPPGVAKQYATVSHVMQIRNGRDNLGEFSMDRQGFVLRHDPDSVLADFYDENAVESRYYEKVAELIQRETGAAEVIVFDHTYRSSRALAPGEPDANQPVLNVHSDYTNESGPGRARAVAGDSQQQAIDEERYWIVNVWRPITGPVEQKPLALCDVRSMHGDDFVAADIKFPTGRNGQVMAIKHRDSHRWFYFPAMTVDEVLIFKSFDPRESGARRYGAHSSVDEPDMTGDERIRESIEIRAVAIFAQ
jgi:hypothetical protein